jgi:hypothetical protein
MRDLIKKILREELFENRPKVSDEEIRRRISKFETLMDLRKYDNATYVMAKRRGEDFFDEVTKDLVRKGIKRTRWSNMSEEELIQMINKFTDTNALRTYEPLLYNFLRTKGEDYYNKMTQGLKRIKPRLRLTPDDILNIASQYNSFSELSTGNPSAYHALRNRYYKMGDKELWDKVVNMFSKKDQQDPYIEELTEVRRASDGEIRARIKKFKTLLDLIKGDKSAYYAAKRRGKDFFEDVTKHLVRQKKEFTRWSGMSEKDLLKMINKFSDTNSLRTYEPSLYTFLKTKGEDYFEKMTQGLKRINPRLSPDDILNIASQYNSFSEFMSGNPAAYNALRYRYHKLGDKELRDKVENIVGKSEYQPEYTDDELIQIASKYPTLKSFSKSEPNIYITLNRRRKLGNLKLYNDATKHMQRSKPPMLKDNEIDSIKSVISQYDNLKDFVENEPNLFISMKRRGPVSFYDLTKDLEQNYDVKW